MGAFKPGQLQKAIQTQSPVWLIKETESSVFSVRPSWGEYWGPSWSQVDCAQDSQGVYAPWAFPGIRGGECSDPPPPMGCPRGVQQIPRYVSTQSSLGETANAVFFLFLMSRNFVLLHNLATCLTDVQRELTSFLIILFFPITFICVILIFSYIFLFFPNFEFSKSLSLSSARSCFPYLFVST